MTTVATTAYGLKREVDLAYEDTVARVRNELGTEGFGVLTEIDVRDTLKQKIDVDFRPYLIIGACNPPLAHQALSNDTDIGLLLPCNLVVYQAEQPDRSVVAAIDPVTQLSIAGNDDLGPIANDVKARLTRVLERIA